MTSNKEIKKKKKIDKEQRRKFEDEIKREFMISLIKIKREKNSGGNYLN